MIRIVVDNSFILKTKHVCTSEKKSKVKKIEVGLSILKDKFFDTIFEYQTVCGREQNARILNAYFYI